MPAHAEVVANMDPEHNKNRLNNIHQRLFHDVLPEYTYEQSGPCHDPTWQCNIYVDKKPKPIAIGGGTSMQNASEAAALSAIQYLHSVFHAEDPDAFR